ncbi:unnamed protein product [Rotaria sp. Silwood2]|nr:unnamed protein product [Rotaria sp. Silwood2]
MPGQGQELIQIAQLQSQAREEQQFQLSISNEMVQSHRSWKYEKVMSTFGCTRHAITAARQMYDDEEYLLNKDQEPVIRQRADPEKIKHFVSWLVESTYGLTTLRMDDGEKYELPKQIIQSQRSHALADYTKYCDETGFQSLGKSKLYDIIDSIKPAEQRTVAGLDEFVVEGIEAWRSLSSKEKEFGSSVLKSNLFLLVDIVETMPIPQADRKRLVKQTRYGRAI